MSWWARDKRVGRCLGYPTCDLAHDQGAGKMIVEKDGVGTKINVK